MNLCPHSNKLCRQAGIDMIHSWSGVLGLGSRVWQTKAADRFTIIGVTEDVITIAAFRRLLVLLSRRGFQKCLTSSSRSVPIRDLVLDLGKGSLIIRNKEPSMDFLCRAQMRITFIKWGGQTMENLSVPVFYEQICERSAVFCF